MAFDATPEREPERGRPGFDDLCCNAASEAHSFETLAMAAFFAKGAVASETLARQALTHFDDLTALVTQLRARLAKPNPHSEV